ncbi:MAG TPA: DUF58 domain-containing protein [Planctomycetaceae bacterium]|nr:DUF58 domain-containing protein [Planctomycetaceae bacterium]
MRDPSPTQLIDPATLMRIRSLELRAKHVVEGFFAGLNRSPYHGFSVEFTEYRQYSPGDDLRYLDWKLFARSDRYYIKRFEDETNLRCHVLVDLSRSMSFTSLDYTKADYARTLAATLGYFLLAQRDAVGLMTFDEGVDAFVPARFRQGQLRRLMTALDRETAGASTDLTRPLESIAERIAKRGMLILVSDLLAPVAGLETSLGYLRARGHEVLVFQVLDPAELDLTFNEPALLLDAETGREVYIDPEQARAEYRRKLAAHTAAIQTICDRLGITFRRFTTDDPLENALAEFLRSRTKGKSQITSTRSQAMSNDQFQMTKSPAVAAS